MTKFVILLREKKMAGIKVYNRTKEDHSVSPYNFQIFRPSILGNPYTHIKDRNTKAKFIVNSREEAIEKYSEYFDIMYKTNVQFAKTVDQIYDAYKAGNDVFLECYCAPLPCHGDVIVRKLRKRLIKEKLNGK